jgi:hypothetical protein
MHPEPTTIDLHLSDPTADTAVLELLTHQLRRLLLTLDPGPAWHPTAGDPPQPPTIDLVDTGSMRITVAPSRTLLTGLIEMIRTWVMREDRVAVTLQVGDARLTILGTAAPDRGHTIDTWVRRALGGGPYDDTWLP